MGRNVENSRRTRVLSQMVQGYNLFRQLLTEERLLQSKELAVGIEKVLCQICHRRNVSIRETTEHAIREDRATPDLDLAAYQVFKRAVCRGGQQRRPEPLHRLRV